MKQGRQADDSLVPLLKADSVSMETLHERYGPLLELVEVLIGVVPNSDTYMEIWPPAFRTYNVMVPNFLDLPFGLFGMGDSPKELVGLGMYVASRAAECSYCSAHCCSFALRRGAIFETIARALDPDAAKQFSPRERATIAVARSLARIPCELSDEERKELEAHFSPSEAEWVVSGVVMMGYLNKFMDTVGVELEQSTVAEVAVALGEGWDAGKSDADLPEALSATEAPAADTLWTKLKTIPKLPKALMLDSKWQRGVPSRWPEVGAYLEARTGHPFPVLSRLSKARVVRAIATMLKENLNPEDTAFGLDVKARMGIIFCAVVDDRPLHEEMAVIAAHFGTTPEQLEAAQRFALDPEAPAPSTEPKLDAAYRLARAASPSPAAITPELVKLCREVKLTAASIVELVSWISVLQMLHRLTCYFR